LNVSLVLQHEKRLPERPADTNHIRTFKTGVKKMQTLIIDPEFKNLIEPLMHDEFEGLEKNILAHGCLDTIKIWNDIIIDGHNRYDICQKHNIPYITKTIEFQSRNDAKIWIIKNQFDRRNLSAWQRGQMALELKEIFSEKAKENQIRKPESFSPILAEQKVDTREEMAKSAGLSHGTIDKIKKIKLEATSEQIARLDNREASINEVYKEIAVDDDNLPRNIKPFVINYTGNNEWYTPFELLESVRVVMGSIDTDPASSELANTVVKADTFYTIEDNGLDKEWHGNVFMNPPYSTDLIPAFVNKLIAEYGNEHIKEAIILVNNATETKWFQSLVRIASAVCFTFGRTNYWRAGDSGGKPLQGQAFVYIGNNPIGFGHEFAKHGWVAYFIDKLFPDEEAYRNEQDL